MGRAKLNMELIPKEKSRNSTFVKRKKGLKKKTFEFATLCGVDACMIIYGPKQPGQGDRPIEPETYPNNPAEVHRIINRYRDIARDERGVGGKRNNNLFDFFEDRKKKMDEELVKLRKKNDQSELDMLDDWIKDFKVEELKEFMGKLESGIEKMDARIELIKAGGKQSDGGLIEYIPDTGNQNLYIQSLCNLPPVPLLPPSTTTTTTSTSTFHGCRENDMVYQPPLCCVKPSSFDHRPFQFNQYDPPLFNLDNGPMTIMMNNGYENLHGAGPFGNYSNPMVMPTPRPFKNNMSFVHEPTYPTVGMSYDDFDESFRIPSMGCYYTPQPNTSHLQHMMPGSSAQVMMHQNHNNHYQPFDELSDSMMNNQYNKKSRFD